MDPLSPAPEVPATGVTLAGFAYGEHLDDLTQRSFGYRLLAPPEPAPWGPEVEALARQLQATPYPDHWPPCDLFCSVLLSGGLRLIAVARYGLADRSPSQRRGGLELIGVVGPAAVDVAQARAVYQWLKKRRADTDRLHQLGGTFPLGDVVAAAVPEPPPLDPTPVLPVRLWQEGALLFAATIPSDPDHRLNLLEQEAQDRWQWLPLVGPDFPLHHFAQRGPLMAWTPNLAGVAVKLDRRADPGAPAPAAPSTAFGQAVVAALVLLVGALTATNLWLTASLRDRPAAAAGEPAETKATVRQPATPAEEPSAEARDRFARALYDLLVDRGVGLDAARRDVLLAEYDRVAGQYKDLRLPAANREGQLAVGAASLTAERTPARIEKLAREALSMGYDAGLVDAVCKKLRQQLEDDLRKPR